MPQQLPPVGGEVVGFDGLPAIGEEVRQSDALPVPDFRSEVKASDSGFSTGDVLKGWWQNVNPLPLLQSISSMSAEEFDAAKQSAAAGDYGAAFGHVLKGHPIATAGRIVAGLGAAQWDQVTKARDAFQQGRMSEGTGYALAGLLPVIGPMAADAGETIGSGDVDRGVGQALGALTPFARVPKSVQARMPASVRLPNMRNANPTEAAAVDAGLNAGVKVDAATATGNPVMRGSQWALERTVGGSTVGRQARTAHSASLARRGADLARWVDPVASVPETAGAAVLGSVQKLTGDLGEMASEAYGRLRKIEADPKHAETVRTHPEGSAAFNRLLDKLGKDGPKPTTRELQIMRQIETELDAQPFQRGKLVVDSLDGAGETHFARGSANANVYHDIQQAAGSDALTGSEMLSGIRQTLETGKWNAASRAVHQVAQQRSRSGGSLTGPSLALGTAILGKIETIGLPVHLEQAKSALQPLYQRLKRESELVPLMGDKARALTALDRLINGPDVAPVSIVDEALGDLKSMARADIPELRTQGQGAAAFAVRELHAAVDRAVQKAGPEAVNALDEGRGATRAKYETGDLLEQLRTEPVGVYRQATAPKDAGINLLREIKDKAPGDIPKVGRAVLEDLLTTATAEGGFDRAAGLSAKWQQLGPETKRILFDNPSMVADLDQFFLLAKKAAENPNPSGTGFQVAVTGQAAWMLTDPITSTGFQIGAAALTKLLHNQRFVRALIKERRIPVTDKGARHAAILQIANIAGESAVKLPTAAERREETPQPTSQR